MSERLNQLAVQNLRTNMFPLLPSDIQVLFPTITDPYLGTGPNIFVGALQERGSQSALPAIAVWSVLDLVPLSRQKYAHLTLNADTWAGSLEGGNVDGRKFVAIVGSYIRGAFQDQNWSGSLISIQRSYMIDNSGVVFDGVDKLYHQLQTYRVEAVVHDAWY